MRKSLLILLLSLLTISSNAQIMKLGDINRDNQVNITDIVTLVDIVMNGYSPFDVSPKEITMKAGGNARVAIEGGYYYYEVESANPDVVTASLNDMTVTLTAVGGGETYVTVKDVLTFRNIIIHVVVEYDDLPVSTNELTLTAGEQGTVTITSGSGYYSVKSSDVNVATARVTYGTVTVAAVGAGKATITITDTKTAQMAYVEVTVENPPLALSTSSLSLYVGDEVCVEFTSGNIHYCDNYDVQSSDENVAITTKKYNDAFYVAAVGTGTATITVKDLKSGQSTTIGVTVNISSCPDEHHPHMIDLGLPSGTKWACCNVGTYKPEAYGGYYAWGETEEKSEYNDVNYHYATGSGNVDGDYLNGEWQDIGSDIAGTQYDVAHVKWGGSWVMPSLEQNKELCNNCTYVWISRNGVTGGLFNGLNGGSIFLPATSKYPHDASFTYSPIGYYWSSTMHPSKLDEASMMIFDSSVSDEYRRRSFGFSVRPVTASTPLNELTLSINNIELKPGESFTVKILSGNGTYEISNSNSEVITASLNGTNITITAKNVGPATVTVTEIGTGVTKEITVSVLMTSYLTCPDDHHPHLIDLGFPSGTKWACCNVGANKPEERGGYYAWGETEEKSEYNDVTYVYATGVDEDGDGYYDDYHSETGCYGIWQDIGSDIGGTQYDVAHVKWGGFWKMPSINQINELIDYCYITFKWTSMNGVKGGLLTGPNGGTIFMPSRSYWSSTLQPSKPYSPYYMYFDSYGPSLDYIDFLYRSGGLCVRAVSK